GEDTGPEGAERSADGVNTEGVQRIVITEPAFDLVTEEPGDQPGRYANEHPAGRINEPARGRDHHQPSDGAGAEAEHTGLAFDHPFRHGPDEGGHGGSVR